MINKRLIITILLLALLPALFATQAFAANRGIFIGTSIYTDGSRPLPDTRYDANDMHNAMVRRGAVRREDASLMTGNNTKNELLANIQRQGQNMGPNDTLYIFNASHGDNGIMCASDGNITPQEMAAAIQPSGAGNVVIMNDSCDSESFQVSVPGKNIAHINAARTGRISYSSGLYTQGMGHINGAMTRNLIEGLENDQADINGDGRISSRELAAWANAGTRLEEPERTLHSYGNTRRTQGPNHQGQDVEVVTEDHESQDVEEELLYMAPRVIGKTEDEAIWMLEKDHFSVNIEDYTRDMVKKRLSARSIGKVMRCSPRRGTRLPKGAPVTIWIPREKDFVVVPNVLEMNGGQAINALTRAGLRSELIGGPGAAVVYQSPTAGNKYLKNSIVKLKRGNVGVVIVPRLKGKTRPVAKSIIKEHKLTPAFIVSKPDDYDANKPFNIAGKVHKSNPPKGENVPVNSTVTCQVAPDDPVDVPNVMGMTEDEARSAVTGAGLDFSRMFVLYTPVSPRGIIYFKPAPQAFKGDTILVDIEYPEIPDLIGMSDAAARAACESAKLNCIVDRKIILGNMNFQQVAEQNPAAGSQSNFGNNVTVFFPLDRTKVPGIIGMDAASAASAITNAALIIQVVPEKPAIGQYEEFSPMQIAGKVWKQSPAPDAEVAVNSVVNVSIGPDDYVKVPDLGGMKEEEARSALSGADFSITVKKIFTEDSPRGSIFWTPFDYAYKGDIVIVEIEYAEGEEVEEEESLEETADDEPGDNDLGDIAGDSDDSRQEPIEEQVTPEDLPRAVLPAISVLSTSASPSVIYPGNIISLDAQVSVSGLKQGQTISVQGTFIEGAVLQDASYSIDLGNETREFGVSYELPGDIGEGTYSYTFRADSSAGGGSAQGSFTVKYTVGRRREIEEAERIRRAREEEDRRRQEANIREGLETLGQILGGAAQPQRHQDDSAGSGGGPDFDSDRFFGETGSEMGDIFSNKK